MERDNTIPGILEALDAIYEGCGSNKSMDEGCGKGKVKCESGCKGSKCESATNTVDTLEGILA